MESRNAETCQAEGEPKNTYGYAEMASPDAREELKKQYVEFLKIRISKSGSVSIQNLTGHLSSLPANVRNYFGASKQNLRDFLSQNVDLFYVDAKENVWVNPEPKKVETIVQVSKPNNTLPRTLTEMKGKILRIFPTYGFISATELYKEVSVYFGINQFERGQVKDLNCLNLGDYVYFNAMIGPDGTEAEYKATQVWRPSFKEISIQNQTASALSSSTSSLASQGEPQPVFGKFGVVVTFQQGAYGFIHPDDAKHTKENVYFTVSSVQNKGRIETLRVGDKVKFDAVPSSKPGATVSLQAVKVWVLESFSESTGKVNLSLDMLNNVEGVIINKKESYGFIQPSNVKDPRENAYFRMEAVECENPEEEVQIGTKVKFCAIRTTKDDATVKWHAIRVMLMKSGGSLCNSEIKNGSESSFAIDDCFVGEGKVTTVFKKHGFIMPKYENEKVIFHISVLKTNKQVESLDSLLKVGDLILFEAKPTLNAEAKWEAISVTLPQKNGEIIPNAPTCVSGYGKIETIFKRFGFIKADEGENRIFFHEKTVKANFTLGSLDSFFKINDRVFFNALLSTANASVAKWEATEVTIPQGTDGQMDDIDDIYISSDDISSPIADDLIVNGNAIGNLNKITNECGNIYPQTANAATLKFSQGVAVVHKEHLFVDGHPVDDISWQIDEGQIINFDAFRVVDSTGQPTWNVTLAWIGIKPSLDAVKLNSNVKSPRVESPKHSYYKEYSQVQGSISSVSKFYAEVDIKCCTVSVPVLWKDIFINGQPANRLTDDLNTFLEIDDIVTCDFFEILDDNGKFHRVIPMLWKGSPPIAAVKVSALDYIKKYSIKITNSVINPQLNKLPLNKRTVENLDPSSSWGYGESKYFPKIPSSVPSIPSLNIAQNFQQSTKFSPESDFTGNPQNCSMRDVPLEGSSLVMTSEQNDNKKALQLISEINTLSPTSRALVMSCLMKQANREIPPGFNAINTSCQTEGPDLISYQKPDGGSKKYFKDAEIQTIATGDLMFSKYHVC